MTEERQSLFSVKDVEKAIVHFGIMEAIYPLLVIGYVLIAGGYTPLETLFLITAAFSAIYASWDRAHHLQGGN